MVQVISLGGSIISPGEVDTAFLRAFRTVVVEHVETRDERLILVTGGGAPARQYQAAYRELASEPRDVDQDWIGVAATRLNAELLRAVLSDYCHDPVVIDPTDAIEFTGRILLAAGWKPGFSTDYDAVLLAERFSANTVVNLSNVEKVYTADPKRDPTARALDALSWREFRELVGTDWKPGSNLPFDPVASGRAEAAGLRVVFAGAGDIGNLRAVLRREPFVGTTIGPG